jgi:hypothetical protein
MDRWPSERSGQKIKKPWYVVRKRLDRHTIFKLTNVPDGEPEPIDVIGRDILLMTEVEAKSIRTLAREVPSATWLDPNQTAIRTSLPSTHYVERRVECYRWPGIREIENGEPTGYMIEQEVSVQILVAREIRDNRVVREWEEDYETVPLWHYIDQGCLGQSYWRSAFAEYIEPRSRIVSQVRV